MHGEARQSVRMEPGPNPSSIGIEIDGPGRAYFDTVVTDNIIDMVMELAAEVWTVRDRQYVMENVLASQGIDAATLIEAHRPTAEEIAARRILREAFVARLLAGFLRRANVAEDK